ncbi:MAG: diadenylate cyclase CdaA [Bacteroidales bacterium]|nr:diadenylate cyclase CdaA [Bacteroidales bacterium]
MDILNICFIALKIVDIIDIIAVALLLYALYRLLRGTAAINIFFGIIVIFLLWKVVEVLQMKMLSEILGAFISVGFIALIVVFQPEIREFLLIIGKPIRARSRDSKNFFFRKLHEKDPKYNYAVVIKTAYNLARTYTGAIIVITRENALESIISTGQVINGDISERLLDNLFFKNSPLHDGAVIITKDKIMAAGCILPVSQSQDLPTSYGLRHRSALGITEQTDAVVIVVSEQRGEVSLVVDGKILKGLPQTELSLKMEEFFPSVTK